MSDEKKDYSKDNPDQKEELTGASKNYDRNYAYEKINQGALKEGDVNKKDEEKKFEPQDLLKNKKLLFGIGGAILGILIIALIFMFLSSRPITVDLNKYSTVEFSGFEGSGRAVHKFDYESFKNDYGQKIWNKVRKSKKYKKSKNLMDGLDFFGGELGPEIIIESLYQTCVDGELDNREELKTGDKVKFLWKVNDELAKEEYKVKFKYKDQEFEVEGLDSLTNLDPFKDVQVRFSGISPYIKAEIIKNTKDDRIHALSFGLDKTDNIKNGETVRAFVKAENGEASSDAFSDRGFLLAETSKDFIVEGQDSYIDSIDDIPEEDRAKMEAQARDSYTAYVNKEWGNGAGLTGLEYVGSYLLKNKFQNQNFDDNAYIVVLKFICEVDNERYEGKIEGYQAFTFSNLLISDGKLSYNLKSMKAGRNRFGKEIYEKEGDDTRNYYVDGYENIDELFKNEVGSYIDNYTYEASNKLK